MRIASFMALFLGGMILVSCSRSSSVTSGNQSVEQRVSELERQVGGGAPPMSEVEARRQYEHDLAEIRSMGLVDRAQRDFSTRLTNATIDTWRIGYFAHTNTVWCDVRHRLPGSSETVQQEFGYTRKDGTNWSLIWGTQ